ncbi:hypothetical protein [Aeromonas salmonicida]|uniref:hypothetical protein n=1 Tax=Aeromonas salmonicida TaxID=645 RepID=UPI000A9251E5|nr:hypothetical protein [Aeromonas salmonicida]MDE7526870.1 hypothetical protein [Aeromonas salmonicida]MDE7531245.1 hypothetical protein [Aeromonas salmonicida]
MLKEIENICTTLNNVSDYILSSNSSDVTFLDSYGWNCPALTRHDLALLASSLSNDIKQANIDSLPEHMMPYVQDLPRRLLSMQSNTLVQLWSGNCTAAITAYSSTISSIRFTFKPFLCWQEVPDSKTLPPQVIRNLNKIKDQVDSLLPDKDLIAKQLKEIQDAHTVAENFPADLQELKKGRDRIARLAEESAINADKSRSYSQASSTELDKLMALGIKAEKTMNQCEDAYRAAASKGLAASFDARADDLKVSIRYWVGGLAVALLGGSILGSNRIKILSDSLSSSSPQWGVIIIHIALSILSIGAPIWFAWMATKQIGQRFKLREDYAFKASVARAYEGYRKEAARIDPAFEARLFSSALTRLEEAPLRLVDDETHGSPWHEFFSSKPFQDAMRTFPELKEKYIFFAKEGGIRANIPSDRENTKTDHAT